MSRAHYIRNHSRLITLTCEWYDGRHYTYEYKFIGDVIDAIISCHENVVWSKLESFRITNMKEETT